jgi:hypothetical protein
MQAKSHSKKNQDSIAGIVTSLNAGRPTSLGSTPMEPRGLSLRTKTSRQSPRAQVTPSLTDKGNL